MWDGSRHPAAPPATGHPPRATPKAAPSRGSQKTPRRRQEMAAGYSQEWAQHRGDSGPAEIGPRPRHCQPADGQSSSLTFLISRNKLTGQEDFAAGLASTHRGFACHLRAQLFSSPPPLGAAQGARFGCPHTDTSHWDQQHRGCLAEM